MAAPRGLAALDEVVSRVRAAFEPPAGEAAPLAAAEAAAGGSPVQEGSASLGLELLAGGSARAGARHFIAALSGGESAERLAASFEPNRYLGSAESARDAAATFCARARLAPAPLRLTFVFHGTSSANISSILQTNLDPKRRRRQAHGKGEYVATDPNVAVGYMHGTNRLVVLLLAADVEGMRSLRGDNVVVVRDTALLLPLREMDKTHHFVTFLS